MDTLQTAENMGFLNKRPQGIFTKVKMTSYSNGLGECVYTKLNTADMRVNKKRKKSDDDIQQEETKEEKIIELLPSLEDLSLV